MVIEENDFEARVYKSKKFEFSLYSIGFSNYQVAIKDVDNNILIMDQNFDFIKSNDNTIDYVESLSHTFFRTFSIFFKSGTRPRDTSAEICGRSP